MTRQWREKLGEIFNIVKKVVTPATGSLIVPEPTSAGIIYPEPSFEKMAEVLNGDTEINSAIQFIADVATGGGFTTSMNEEYTVKTTDYKTAKEVVDEKCEEFGMDELIQEITKDIIAYGNSVLWKRNPEKIEILARILPATITSFEYDKETNMFLRGVKTRYYTFPADELIVFSYNRIGKTPCGYGILQALCTELRTGRGFRPSLAEIKNRILKAMAEQIEKFSSYNELWILEGVDDKKAQQYQAQIKNLYNARLVFNPRTGQKASVVQIVPERMRGLDFYAETLWNSFYLGLGTPYPKLILGGGPGFTEAAARAAMQIGERRISALQRYVKRMVEREIFDRWVSEEGLDAKQASVRLNWKLIERPGLETLLPVVEKTWELGGITTAEWRDFLMACGVGLTSKEKPRPMQSQVSEKITFKVT